MQQKYHSVTLLLPILVAMVCMLCCVSGKAQSSSKTAGYLFNDSHFHLTNYIQEGITVKRHLELMGDKVSRSTLFGIPLQQQWSYENSGTFAPSYYL